MNCKFCNAELPEEVTLCPECGKENMEEIPAQEVPTQEVPTQEVPTQEVPVEEVAAEEILAEETPVEETPAEEATAEEATAEEATDEEAPVEEVPAEDPPKKRSVWKTVLAIVGGLVIAAVLIGAVLYGTMGEGKFIKADSYTVSVAKAEKERDTVVATVGTRELINSELQAYYWQVINDFYSYYGYYMDLSTLGLDLEQPLDQQFYDETNGITWQQYFVDMAMNTWHRYAALDQLAQSEGYALSAEQQAYLDSIPQDLEAMAVAYGYADAADMLYQDMGPACDVNGYMRFIELNYYVGQYFDQVYTKLAPSLEEMESYYAENTESLNAMGIVQDGGKYVDVRHVLLTPEGELDSETGEMVYSDEAWETCRVEAQDFLDQWLAGDATEESFAQLAVEHSQDPGSQSQGGLYTDVYVGQMVEPFEDWCFDESRAYGDSGLVQTTYGYHIMYYVASEEIWISDLRSQMVSERSTQLVEQTIEQYPMETNMKKVVLCDAPDAE